MGGTILVFATTLVIAEGVESEVQREFLQQSGCRNYQGYLFGKPMPIEDWDKIL